MDRDAAAQVVELRRMAGLSPPANAAEALADVIVFGEDEDFRRALDIMAPPNPEPADQTMSDTSGTPVPSDAKSLRDRIAASAPPRRRESTTLGGVPVDVIGMTTGEKNGMMDESTTTTGSKVVVKFAKYYPQLLIRTVVVPGTEERIFGPDDVAAINALDSEEVERVAGIASRLSGLDKDAEKRAAGNSGGASGD